MVVVGGNCSEIGVIVKVTLELLEYFSLARLSSTFQPQPTNFLAAF